MGGAGLALLAAADKAAGGRATHAHVATEEGEVFAVARAASDGRRDVRFTLASLVFADMRAALRRAGAFRGGAATAEAA